MEEIAKYGNDLMIPTGKYDFLQVYNSPAPVIDTLVKSGREMEARKIILKICLQWLNRYSPGQDNANFAADFCDLVIETRPDWKMADVAEFFRFIIRRQDITENRIFGNKITTIHLGAILPIFEGWRSEQRENIKQAEKTPENANFSPQAGEFIQKIEAKLNGAKKQPEKPEKSKEDPFQEKLKEFDRLFYQDGRMMNGQRFVKFGEKYVNQSEFLEIG